MREIKFRAWDGSQLEQVAVFNMGGLVSFVRSANDFFIATDLMQYTGLKDVNGVEIYEGDIYTQGDLKIKYEAIFERGMFIGKQVGNDSLAGISHFQPKIEVIGNIHENPELLNNVPR